MGEFALFSGISARLLAEQIMDVSTLKGMLGKKFSRPGARRRAASWAMKEKRYNQKRACAFAGIGPRVYRRVMKRPAYADLRDRLKALSSERRRFGYRRLHFFLKREGWKGNGKSCFGSTAKKD